MGLTLDCKYLINLATGKRTTLENSLDSRVNYFSKFTKLREQIALKNSINFANGLLAKAS